VFDFIWIILSIWQTLLCNSSSITMANHSVCPMSVCYIREVCKSGDSCGCHSWLAWKVNSSSLRSCKTFRGVIWPWRIYLSPKYVSPIKIAYFRYIFCRFVRKPFEIPKSLQWTAIKKVCMGFPAIPQCAPMFTHPLTWGWKHERIAKICNFYTAMIALCCDVHFPHKNDSTLLWYAISTLQW